MNYRVIDGNEACALISYLFTEIAGIYPITPSSKMAELVEKYSKEGVKNIFDTEVKTVEMQSEAGSIGLVHGALQGGSFASTYTSSQGLLLMIPEMYKIAGELLPSVINVASRTVSTHALSIFGDHSDIYATRSTGYSFLCSSSVQDVVYMTLIAYLSTMKGKIPFVNFFDGFRTSHELSKIGIPDLKSIKSLVDDTYIKDFKDRSLVSKKVIRGTTQNDDIYFQNLESRNTYYENMPDIVYEYMKKINRKYKTSYKPFNYYGDKDAQRVIVAMGSVCETIKEYIDIVNKKGLKIGLIEVHLFRPFSKKYFLSVLPKTTKTITVLDRAKESGTREALFMDVSNIILSENKDIKVIGGIYGLSSKDTNLDDINAVYYNMDEDKLKDNFSLSITDDVTNRSLPKIKLEEENKDDIEMLIYGYGSDGMVSATKDLIKLVGENTNAFVQCYNKYDSKKSGGVTISNLRIGKKEIRKTYYVDKPHIVVCSKESYLNKYDMLENIRDNGIFILDINKNEIKNIPNEVKYILAKKNINFYIIDAHELARINNIPNKISYILEAAIINITKVLPYESALDSIKESIKDKFDKKDKEISENNIKAISMVKDNIIKIDIDKSWKKLSFNEKKYNNIIDNISHLKGDSLKVSDFSNHYDGSYEPNTSKLEKRNIAELLPCYNSDNCINCNRCVIACPHGVIKPKILNKDELKNNKDISYKTIKGKNGLFFALEFSYDDCTGCSICSSACKTKAITMVKNNELKRINNKISNVTNKFLYDEKTTLGIGYNKSLFNYSGACAGCGQTPYIKLLTQVVKEGLVIANATGCSSIYGGSMPSSPYNISWSNSLFEDNAEYGFGIQTSIELNKEKIMDIINKNIDNLGKKNRLLLKKYIENEKDYKITKFVSENLDYSEIKELKPLKNYIPSKSVWLIGGDGWSYDIDFGGIDHVVSQGKNINILILDNEIYSNTGGQSSKSTQEGVVSLFSSKGKETQKKDLAKILMNYKNVYIAQICLGKDMNQAIKALNEANEFDGPSIVIAYSPCIIHGIKGGMKNSLEEEKLAVDSGYFPIFRYNSKLNSFKLDYKTPDFSLYGKFLINETRYKMISAVNKDRAKELLENNLNNAKERFEYYKNLETKKDN